MEDVTTQQVKIERRLYEQEQLHKDFEYQRHKTCGKYYFNLKESFN